MPDSYELVLHNSSAQPDLAFIVYAVPAMNTGVRGGVNLVAAREGYPIAWQEQGVNPGSAARFQWTASFALMCARQPCKIGDVWQQGATHSVGNTGGAYLLDYTNDDYCFSTATPSGDLPPSTVDLYTSGRVPVYGEQGPSVGLAVSTGRQSTMLPVIVANSGPNLAHRISLTPVYRIWAGQDAAGAMLDPATVRGRQQVQFSGGSVTEPWRAEWTLDADNRWRSGKPQ